MAKRGLSSSENQTKSAKKKKAEDAEVDAAPGSRVYTVEYQVDTAIDEFDEDVMDGYAGYQGGYHEDRDDEMESAEQRERDAHEVHKASQHLGVVYGSMASAKAAAKDTVIRLCKEYWKLEALTDKELDEEDDIDEDDEDECFKRYIDVLLLHIGNDPWTGLYTYDGSWNMKHGRDEDEDESDVPAHKMSAIICVGVRELEVR